MDQQCEFVNSTTKIIKLPLSIQLKNLYVYPVSQNQDYSCNSQQPSIKDSLLDIYYSQISTDSSSHNWSQSILSYIQFHISDYRFRYKKIIILYLKQAQEIMQIIKISTRKLYKQLNGQKIICLQQSNLYLKWQIQRSIRRNHQNKKRKQTNMNALIDFKNAYDSVNRNQLIRIIQRKRILNDIQMQLSKFLFSNSYKQIGEHNNYNTWINPMLKNLNYYIYRESHIVA